jgi:hypothetical protein
MQIVGALVFGIIYFLCGIGVLIYMTQFSCKKKDIARASIDAATMGGFMTIAYLMIPYLGILTTPVKNVLLSFHVSEGISTYISEFYILMLFSWIVTTWFGLKIQSLVCKPSKSERKKFKQELQKNLNQLKLQNGNNSSTTTTTSSS